MPIAPEELHRFLSGIHPYDALDTDALEALVPQFVQRRLPADEPIYAFGHPLEGLYLVHSGQVEIRDENEVVVSLLGPRNSFGERGLARDGIAATSARTVEETLLLMLPAYAFDALVREHPAARRFFDRSRAARPRKSDLAHSRVETLMAPDPLTLPASATVQEAARAMAERHVSSVCITDGPTLKGILTLRDVSGKVVGRGLPFDTKVAEVMTADPLTLPPSAIGSDVLHMMMERHIGHVPVSEGGRLVGMVTQTDLTRFQAVSSAELVAEIARATTPEDMARVTARIPQLLVQLVAGGNRHEVVTRLITDITDTVTRRLLALAEERLGAAPVPYLWLACGSQGRQEQTGISDQDNCLFLDNAATADDMAYFRDMAAFVSDGLDRAGYYFCPGDMMATNPKWCQPVGTWRQYFTAWIAKPDPMAQMLASVMFDLRPIGGTKALYEDLQGETLEAASKNSIFVSHMIANSLKHTPPLGLLRGFATIRSGEHKNTVDLKHNGVVPVVDLARVYALQGQLVEVNTRARLEAAVTAGKLSASGGQDLLDAYDLIAETRLEHQAARIKAGEAPDNYLAPSSLSDFERSHLRDAFVVIKSLQSAVGHGRSMLG
ncbi:MULTISPECIES: putative nucleotidyltransferase substrate binding domain-containing protein [Salipiger]|uniref:CBS domain-containing protein n=1 Tax=Salipiger profundus TaxID=1229727 RepID=A0A1U7DB25_9RHOB|nr:MULTISPECIES: putative nucleotidyltransferase substrate binding domain-containing protein [Salipiger]APX25377.1 CBS domain-containing protein [Salipiger profundus]GGA27857.1 histidine kinase [Salipiger profundus]SFD81764.1 CBS domain-containing protein [Salipiger profundus]